MVKAATEARVSVICHSIFPMFVDDVRALLYGNVLLCAVCIPAHSADAPPERCTTVAFGEGLRGGWRGPCQLCRIPWVGCFATTLRAGGIIPIYKWGNIKHRQIKISQSWLVNDLLWFQAKPGLPLNPLPFFFSFFFKHNQGCLSEDGESPLELSIVLLLPQLLFIVALAVFSRGSITMQDVHVTGKCFSRTSRWSACVWVILTKYEVAECDPSSRLSLNFGIFFFYQMNLPLLFLPVHRSHIDYLLLTFILFCHNIKAPYIASGNNLNIPIFR